MSTGLPFDIRLMNAAANLLALAAMLALLATLALWAMRHPVFSIGAIRIEGDVMHTNVPTLRANTLPRLQGNLFTLDLDHARRVFESLPWVRRAVVQRVWPDRLLVTLEEHRPVAYWGEAPDARLLNNHAEVFEANLGDVEDASLPVLRGPQGQARLVLAMHAQLAALLGPVAGQPHSVTLTERGSWQVELAGGSRIELGRGEPREVLDRTARFARTLPQVVQAFERPLLYADLRHRDGYAVRLDGISTLEPGTRPRTGSTR